MPYILCVVCRRHGGGSSTGHGSVVADLIDPTLLLLAHICDGKQYKACSTLIMN